MKDQSVENEFKLELGNGWILRARIGTEYNHSKAGQRDRTGKRVLEFVIGIGAQHYKIDAAEAQVLLTMRAARGANAVASPTAHALASLMTEKQPTAEK